MSTRSVLYSGRIGHHLLQGFVRLRLAPGESRTVAIDLPPGAFALPDGDARLAWFPGRFTLGAGGSQDWQVQCDVNLE